MIIFLIIIKNEKGEIVEAVIRIATEKEKSFIENQSCF